MRIDQHPPVSAEVAVDAMPLEEAVADAVEILGFQDLRT